MVLERRGCRRPEVASSRWLQWWLFDLQGQAQGWSGSPLNANFEKASSIDGKVLISVSEATGDAPTAREGLWFTRHERGGKVKPALAKLQRYSEALLKLGAITGNTIDQAQSQQLKNEYMNRGPENSPTSSSRMQPDSRQRIRRVRAATGNYSIARRQATASNFKPLAKEVNNTASFHSWMN